MFRGGSFLQVNGISGNTNGGNFGNGNNGRFGNISDGKLLSLLKGVSNDDCLHLLSDTDEEFIALKTKSSTRRIYDRTTALVYEYSDKNITFEDMDVKWLNGFRVFLRKYCKSKNGECIHFRNIRVLFNFALSQGTISCYPFKQFKIEGQAMGEKKGNSMSR